MSLSAGPTETTDPNDSATTRRRWWLRWLLAGLLVLAVGVFYALGLHRYLSWDYLRAHLDLLQTEVRQHLVLAVVLFFLVYVGVTALSLPAATALTLIGGALFGRWLGTGVVSLASTSGATLAFLSSRYLFRDWVQQRFGKHLEALNRGVEKDGAYYLLTLRLVPAVPFFVLNLGMGLTPLRVRTFVWVSLLGMLPATFLYTNAGTALAQIDSPRDVLSPGILVSLALLGVMPLVLRWLVRQRVRPRTVLLAVAVLLVAVVAGLGVRTSLRYRTAEVMQVAVKEYSHADYPEDPANRSFQHGAYDGRKLTLVQKDATHFDFVLEPTQPQVARVVFRDIDASLMTPSLPEWTKSDAGLQRIALTDRQWNRQQVAFAPGSPHVELSGGDGFEEDLFQHRRLSAELAKNCLNAGLWEVLLFAVEEDGQKALYYQGWFTFPLGHYRRLFEHNTGLPYWRHWYYLEHWFDPAGTVVPLEKLRRVVAEREVPATFTTSERVFAAGEQTRKRRTTSAQDVVTWGNFYDGHPVRFAAFIPPGRYSVSHAWKNEYRRMDHFERAILREVVSPATEKPLQELELVFTSSQFGGVCRFLVSGFDLQALPQLAVQDYPKGLYRPMGLGVPPFNQDYEKLLKEPPQQSAFGSVLLDGEGRWIDHHHFAIDGPVLHRDREDGTLLHVYLLSYERHTLIAHLVVRTGE